MYGGCTHVFDAVSSYETESPWIARRKIIKKGDDDVLFRPSRTRAPSGTPLRDSWNDAGDVALGFRCGASISLYPRSSNLEFGLSEWFELDRCRSRRSVSRQRKGGTYGIQSVRAGWWALLAHRLDDFVAKEPSCEHIDLDIGRLEARSVMT